MASHTADSAAPAAPALRKVDPSSVVSTDTQVVGAHAKVDYGIRRHAVDHAHHDRLHAAPLHLDLP